MLALIEKVLTGWTDQSRRGGWLLALIFLVATAAAGWYAAGSLKVNTDTSAMLDASLDFQVRARELREAFPEVKNDIAVIIRAPTLDEADALAADLRQRALARPEIFSGVFAPSAEPFFRRNGLLYLDTDELETRLSQMSKAASLIETLIKAPTAGQFFSTLADNDELAEKSDLGKETLARIYDELAGVVEAGAKGEPQPFSWMGAISTDEAPADGYVRLVYVTPKLDFSRLQPAKPALVELRNEIAAAEKSFGGRAETFITGDPALRADELAAVTTGIEISFLISFVSVAVLLLLCYRSVFLALTTLASLVITIVLTGAFAAAAIGELNLISVAFTVLLVGLGLDFAIHLLLHLQERQGGGETLADAMRGSVHEVGPALTLAALTTTLGFFAFIPTAFDGIAQLGIIAGVGVIIALFVTLTFIPAALGAAGGKGRAFTKPKPKQGETLVERLATPVAIATVALGVAALFVLPKARFDADPMSLRDPSSQSVIGFNLLFNDRDTVPYRLTQIATSEAEAEQAAIEARAIATVGAVRSLPGFVPDHQEDKLDIIDFASGSLVFALSATEDKSAAPAAEQGAAKLKARLEAAYAGGTPARRLADALGAVADDEAALARIEASIFAYWPALVERLRDQFDADIIDIDALPDGLKKRYFSADGKWRIDVLPKADVRDPKALKEFVRSVEAVLPDIAGGAIQTEKAGEVISGAMLQASMIALVIISLFLVALLRRVDEVLLMLFPLALAAVLTAAASVLLNVPFNYANVIVLPLLMGIGIDSGIHLVMRQRQLEAGESLFGASTPRAVLFSALTTVASFGSLMLSPHRGTASMGELLTIAIGFTLLCTLIVLPVAFRLFEGRKFG
jgi:hopanoid biosynthesis associated RND transporter like protein HpnN